jgi:glycosyltransferase involved in cell wall biosynthesis
MANRTSVILPVRNGAKFLTEAVASALAQLDAADQLIVVWDLSSDNTAAIVASFDDPRVIAVEGPGRGVSAARNVGLSFAQGELIAFLDHDDFWPSQRHMIMRKALADDPQLDAVFGRMRIQLEPGSTPWKWILELDGRHVPGPNLGTGLFRRSLLCQIDGFDESLHFGEDLDYFDRLKETGMRFGLCEVDGLIYRRHEANCTNDQRAVQNSTFDVIVRKMARNRARGGSSGPG